MVNPDIDAINKLRKYFDSIYRLTRLINTPIISTDLIPYNKEITTHKIKKYQYRIGSLLYMAITTRPNIIFATLKLLHFLTNPNPIHV